jgi:hypothetical protein
MNPPLHEEDTLVFGNRTLSSSTASCSGEERNLLEERREEKASEDTHSVLSLVLRWARLLILYFWMT